MGLGTMVCLICIAVLACLTGTGISLLKNENICLQREINSARNEIAQCDNNIKYYRYKFNTFSSRWQIKERLAANKSGLVEIKPEQIETIVLGGETRAVAAVGN